MCKKSDKFGVRPGLKIMGWLGSVGLWLVRARVRVSCWVVWSR